MKFPFTLKPEQELQIQVYKWFGLQYPNYRDEFHHFANERKCTKIYGHLLELMGVKSGVADIFIDVPRKEYRGLWVELKVGRNKPTESQRRFLERKRQIGYCTAYVVGFDAAIDFIRSYLD